jgi:hypothetical protein
MERKTYLAGKEKDSDDSWREKRGQREEESVGKLLR